MARTRKKKLTMIILTTKASLMRTLKARETEFMLGTKDIVLLWAQVPALGIRALTVVIMVVGLLPAVMVIAPIGMKGIPGPAVCMTLLQRLRATHVAGEVPSRVLCRSLIMAVRRFVVARLRALLTVHLFLLTVILLVPRGSWFLDSLAGVFGRFGLKVKIRRLLALLRRDVEAASMEIGFVVAMLVIRVIRLMMLGRRWEVRRPLCVALEQISIVVLMFPRVLATEPIRVPDSAASRSMRKISRDIVLVSRLNCSPDSCTLMRVRPTRVFGRVMVRLDSLLKQPKL